MKFLIAFAVAVACAHADVSHIVGKDAYVPIVKYESEVNPDSFKYEYETGNKIYGRAVGVLKNGNSENAALEITGENSWVGEDGANYKITYVADENGYQPQGDHLPVAPPVPEAILRAIAYNQAHPQTEEKYARVASPVGSAPVVAPVVSAFASAKAGFNKNRRF